jgi:photosystem II stability/assembly factor-like uncharacterized protein
VTLQEGAPEVIVVGTTFGLAVSRDGGAHWSWICEEAIGYGGSYDTSVVVTRTGTMLVTSFEGLRISRDGGCTWSQAADVGATWAADVALGPDGAIWTVTAAGGAPNRVLVSRDEGESFEEKKLLDDGWFRTVRVAPGDAERVYAGGFRSLPPAVDGGVPGVETLLLDSDDGGGRWRETRVEAPPGTVLKLLGVARADPELVFARLDAPEGDTLLVSRAGGPEPTAAFTAADDLAAFVSLADGTSFLVGSRFAGARLSRDGALTWPELPDPPRMACAAQRADGSIVACGANFAPDGFALASSSDLASWSELFRFQQLEGPLACDERSPVTSLCGTLWPTVMQQIALSERADAGPADAAVVDAGPGASGGGGCGCGGGTAMLLLVVRRRWS